MKTSELNPYPNNPRIHGDGKHLEKSILELGDLSGIVFNVRNNLLVGGHYRVKTIPKESIIEKHDVLDNTGTVAEGVIILPSGQRLNYREVDWDETKHKLACIEANNQKIQWSWDESMLDSQLEDIKIDIGDFDFDEYGLNLFSHQIDLSGVEIKEDNSEEKSSTKANECQKCGYEW